MRRHRADSAGLLMEWARGLRGRFRRHHPLVATWDGCWFRGVGFSRGFWCDGGHCSSGSPVCGP